MLIIVIFTNVPANWRRSRELYRRAYPTYKTSGRRAYPTYKTSGRQAYPTYKTSGRQAYPTYKTSGRRAILSV